MNTVFITGANRGIGFEFAKQLCAQGMQVIATCRKPKDAHALKTLQKQYKNLTIKTLDISKTNDIVALAQEFGKTPIDWLINNAGISGESGVTIGNIARENFLHLVEVNCFGPLKLSEALLPSLKLGQGKLIVCISSKMGSISSNEQGRSYAYRTSKAALNCAMRSFALDVAQDNINVMLLHPGWVKTDLGGPNAPLTPHASVNHMLTVIDKYKHNSHAEVLRGYDDSMIPW
ncbi:MULTISPECIES: SDR family oxidoreductase [Legionella]|uniref:SDR family oxidoreductase n=1 Tax=Legionella septentrionalis TaxID=2498109 RepID=A0A3S0VC19_9GAMM|nr:MULTISPECIES: SDR family oxidoreductase [Legionella]MCP0913128.1 SDR family oxidoreductase [Legionella sp. 27cVA30]RUQ91577.1 SDR family oxidoreductase [Legionella septentrionalis]RUR02486.1 SDR family oxidoreductase [Legionella septentrionalis]RUR10627.1 SDR family oxidoreductase [Legionella septentrionalis]RUR17144.1 SDR family oxidoreductase [Legionella septentrionalis]